MTKILTLAASALALAASGAAFAQQDAYTPPSEDETTPTTEEATLPETESEDDALYGDEAYVEPQGDANDDEGELTAPIGEEAEDDGAEAAYGDETDYDAEPDDEL